MEGGGRGKRSSRVRERLVRQSKSGPGAGDASLGAGSPEFRRGSLLLCLLTQPGPGWGAPWTQTPACRAKGLLGSPFSFLPGRGREAEVLARGLGTMCWPEVTYWQNKISDLENESDPAGRQSIPIPRGSGDLRTWAAGEMGHPPGSSTALPHPHVTLFWAAGTGREL